MMRPTAAGSASCGTFATWLLSITHNMAIDEVRKRRRRPQRADSEDPEAILAGVPDPGPDVEDEVWLTTLRGAVAAAMDQLPPAQRAAIELAYFQGLTQREIAETLGEPLGTIRTRMRLGVRRLRESLEDGEQDAQGPCRGRLQRGEQGRRGERKDLPPTTRPQGR